jgi:AcrR family transcriptional regulator
MTLIEHAADDVGLRERKKQQTRTAIHDAAFRLIEAQGLDATTVEQICQQADVSTRTFFNYYPSKAAAALELPGAGLDPGIRERFLAARGSLVDALCVVVGSSAENGPSRLRMKQLLSQRPELLTTLTSMMVEVRGTYIALAAERASSAGQAELAVALVLTAMGLVMHDDSASEAPLADRLRETVARLVAVGAAELA